MKKLLSLLLVFVMLFSMTAVALADDAPVELTIYCSYDSSKGIDPANLWWWRYAEYRLAQEGYNVKLNVTGGSGEEFTQGRALRLGTGNLPDIMFGTRLSGSEIVLYGDGDGLLLDITPYLNETDMPHAYKCSQTNGADAFGASVSPDGKIYGVPYVVDRTLGWLAGTGPAFNGLWINTVKLKEMGIEMPTTGDELLNALRAAKDYPVQDGKKMIPLITTDGGYFSKALFAYLGFYACDQTYGIQASIKDGAITLPVYTEEYREYLQFFRTLYEEELIPSEFFTMSGETVRAIVKEENFLIYAGEMRDFTDDPAIFHNYTTLPPIYMHEDVLPVISATVPYGCCSVWASAKTQHPKEVCALMDLLYDDEAMMYYWYGPVLEDPLGIMDKAWQVNEEGTDLVHEDIGPGGAYTNINDRQTALISPCGDVGDCSNYNFYAKNIVAGLDFYPTYETYTDCITGKTVTITNKSGYREKYDTTMDAYYRLNRYESWINNLTTVRMSILYVTEEESERITDLESVLKSYVQENFAKFVTGARSLDEFDAYQEELKQLGIEELLDIYQRGYAPYIESVFH